MSKIKLHKYIARSILAIITVTAFWLNIKLMIDFLKFIIWATGKILLITAVGAIGVTVTTVVCVYLLLEFCL